MTPEELQVSITFPGMINRIPIRDLCPQRPRVLGQRMECQSINYDCSNLRWQVWWVLWSKESQQARIYEYLQNPRQLRPPTERTAVEGAWNFDPRREIPYSRLSTWSIMLYSKNVYRTLSILKSFDSYTSSRAFSYFFVLRSKIKPKKGGGFDDLGFYLLAEMPQYLSCSFCNNSGSIQSRK